jgi:hypothetical protein
MVLLDVMGALTIIFPALSGVAVVGKGADVAELKV